MKTKNTVTTFAMGLIMATVLVGCGTPRVGPAKTTLNRMNGVGQVESVRRTTTVTGTTTNIVMVELNETPEAAQKELRLKELEGNTEVGVAKVKAKSSSGGFWATPTYGYYSGGYYGNSYYSGGGYYGSGGCNNFSPNVGGGHVATGGFIVSSPGGNNSNFSPNVGGGGGGTGGSITSSGYYHH